MSCYTVNPEEIKKAQEILLNDKKTCDEIRTYPGRNDPCICGSGKKFKKCCLK